MREQHITFHYKIIQLPGHSSEQSAHLRFIRIMGLVVVIIGVGLLIYHHLYSGPAELAAKSNNLSMPKQLDRADYFATYQLPYLLYLPYSFVQHIVIAPFVFFVILYAAIEDLMRLNRLRQTLHVRFERTEKANCKMEGDRCVTIERNFERFCLNFIDAVGRYSEFAMFLALFFSFEYWFGQYTLQSINARIYVWGILAIIASIIIVIFLGFAYYEDAFQEAIKKLFELRCNFQDFEKEKQVLKLINRIFYRHIALYILLILLTFTPPLAELGKLIIAIL